MGLDYNSIISKIKEKTNLSDKEIEDKVNKKLEKLSDLISKEGAAHIIANELGVKVFEDFQKIQKLKINKLIPGLSSVTVAGKVLNIFEVKSFKKGEREGKVASLILADETSTIRIVLWDTSLIELIEQNKIKVDDILRIKDGYVKQNDFGYMEMHLGNRASIDINPNDEEIGEVSTTPIKSAQFKKISDLQESDFSEIQGTIVQIFEPRFFDACSECGKKVTPSSDGKYQCEAHGVVNHQKVPIANVILDDGTDNIRVVLFRDLVNNLFGEDLTNFDEIKKSTLGKQIGIKGKVVKNQFFDRIEFRASLIDDLNPESLIENFER